MDTVVPINTSAPKFQLPDLSGQVHRLEDFRGQLVLINFWSAECPWAKRADEEILRVLESHGEEVVWLSIAANANESLEQIKETAQSRKLKMVLLDSEQKVAQRYGALTTPHIFIIDHEGVLRYQGAFDDVTFRKREPTQNYAEEALKALTNRQAPNPAETPPYGCTVVYEV